MEKVSEETFVFISDIIAELAFLAVACETLDNVTGSRELDEIKELITVEVDKLHDKVVLLKKN